MSWRQMKYCALRYPREWKLCFCHAALGGSHEVLLHQRVCSAKTFWRFGNRTIPNIQKTQSGSHCGSDVSVGLAQLLPQALRQRRHGKLGAAVEMDVCAVDDAVSTHTASGW